MTTLADPALSYAQQATAAMLRTPELVRQTASLAREGRAEIAAAAAFWADATHLSDGSRAILAAVIDRALAILELPLQDIVSGVPCTWCEADDAWACTRVWDEYGDDPFDVEVCGRCAKRLLVDAPDWVRSEPMTEDDYARYGLHAGPRPLDAWDVPVLVEAWSADEALDLGRFGGAA